MSERGPSVKGAILLLSLESVSQAIRGGILSRRLVEERLGENAALLDAKPSKALWYPVEAMGACCEILAGLTSMRREDALDKIGASAVDLLAKEGLYVQIELAQEVAGAGSDTQVLRFGRRGVTLIRSFYDFGSMEFSSLPERPRTFSIHWREVAPLPDALRFITQGFIRSMIEKATSEKTRVASSRPQLDLIVFEIELT